MTEPNTGAILRRAASEGLTVRVEYRNARGRASDRSVDVTWADGEHFTGHCHRRGEERTFRIDRVIAAEVVGPHRRRRTGPPRDREFWGRWAPLRPSGSRRAAPAVRTATVSPTSASPTRCPPQRAPGAAAGEPDAGVGFAVAIAIVVLLAMVLGAL